jgi:hypothetical protein
LLLARFVLIASTMRKVLLLVLAGATACAARAAHPTLATPTTYVCGETAVTRSGDAFGGTRLGWHDDEGDHFVAWPLSPVDIDAVEIIVPRDPRMDAVRRVYDTSKGTSRADWRLVRQQVCAAKGGYSDVLARFLRGESLDQLAHELALGDRDDARVAVHDAMLALQKRYYRDR